MGTAVTTIISASWFSWLFSAAPVWPIGSGNTPSNLFFSFCDSNHSLPHLCCSSHSSTSTLITSRVTPSSSTQDRRADCGTPACRCSCMAVQHWHAAFLPKINQPQEHQPPQPLQDQETDRLPSEVTFWKYTWFLGCIFHAVGSPCHSGLNHIYFHQTPPMSSASNSASLTYLHCYQSQHTDLSEM